MLIMKIIGLIGGMSCESSALYYKLINEGVRNRLGGNHSAKSILYSVDFDEIVEKQFAGKWDELSAQLTDIAIKLEKIGADAIAICTNLMHKTVPTMEKSIAIPIIHIAHEVGKTIQAAGMQKVGLLGSIFTMQEDFYKNIISEYGITVVTPNEKDMQIVSNILYTETPKGIIKPESEQAIQQAITNMIKKDAIEGVILGCTELPLIIKKSSVELFDTTSIHAQAIIEFVLNE